MSAASIRKGFCRGTLMTSIASAVGLLLFSLAAAQEGPHAPASASTKAAVAKSVHGNPGPLVIYDTLPNFLAATADLGTPSFDDFESGGAKYLPSNQFAACIEPVSSHSNDACYRDGDLVPGISIASNNARGVIVMNPGIYGMASRAIAAWPYRLSSQSYTVVSFDDPPTAVAADVYGFAMGDGAVPVATAPVQIDVYAADDSLIGSFTVEASQIVASVFAGFTSPIPIARVVFGVHVNYAAGPIDNLYFAGGAGKLSADVARFGGVDIGATSTLPVQLTNAGHLPLVLGTLPQAQAPFSFTTDACSGTTLPPGASCTVDVLFAPTFENDFAQTLAVPSNDSSSPTSLHLEGTGVLPTDGVVGGGR